MTSLHTFFYTNMKKKSSTYVNMPTFACILNPRFWIEMLINLISTELCAGKWFILFKQECTINIYKWSNLFFKTFFSKNLCILRKRLQMQDRKWLILKKKKKACNKYNFRVINEIVMSYNIMTYNVLFISGNMIFRDLTHVMIVKWAKSNKNPIRRFLQTFR